MEGISLTVAAAVESTKGARVEIAIIPHTWEATNLKALRAGDPVNIEVDVLAKYAEKRTNTPQVETITIERLLREGF